MSTWRRLLTGFIAVTVLLAGFAFISQGTALAGTGLYYHAVDADNDPYSGIYLRDGTSMSNVRRIAERYMLYGTSIELICGAWGEAVGPYANRRWHYVRVASGATTNQIGWIADRYTDTPNKANEYTPGEPECGAPTPTPTPVSIKSVYFSPYELGSHMPIGGPTVKTVGKSQWTNPSVSCDTSRAIGYVPGTATNLSGWSLGRLGPIYDLKRATDTQKRQINNIMMIDPGSWGEMNASCENTVGAGNALANWLYVNRSARLIIMSGDLTQDVRHPVNGYGSAGIQNFYFNQIRSLQTQTGVDLRSRVLVCNYSVPGTDPGSSTSLNNSHNVMFEKTNYLIANPPTTNCPAISGLNQGTAWHP